MKIGIFSDLHLGKRQYGLSERENDFYDQYHLAIDVFIENEVDLVVCAGDIFDTPRPSPKTLGVFMDGIKKLSLNNIGLINIIGNHSMVQSTGFLTSDELIKNIIGSSDEYMLLNKYVGFSNDDVSIFGLPYYFNYEIGELKKGISFLNEHVTTLNGFKVLVLHQSFKEFCGFFGEELSIYDVDVSNFDLVVCGHIHERMVTQIDNDSGTVFLQPGSLERSTVAEARDEENQGKGVYIIDTDLFEDAFSVANGFIGLRSQRKFFVSDMYMKESEDIDDIEKEILSYIKDCSVEPILFLIVHDVSGSYQMLLDMTKRIRPKCLTVNFNYIDESSQIYDGRIVRDPTDIPTPREALKIAINPMDDDERRLALDIFDLLKNGEDASKIIEDFYDKRVSEPLDQSDDDYSDDELDEIISYFEEK